MTSAPLPQVGVDSYISVEDASTLAAKLIGGDAWRSAFECAALAWQQQGNDGSPPSPPDECCRALFSATAVIDRLKWRGVPADPSQPLAWPRRLHRHRHHCETEPAITPNEIATACAELAFYLLADRRRVPSSVQMEQIGSSMMSYFPTVADELPKHVRRLIEPYLAAPSTHSAEVVL